jgi:hypothetical protein
MGHNDELPNQLLKEHSKALEAIANIPREALGNVLFSIPKFTAEAFAKNVLADVAAVNQGVLRLASQQAHLSVAEVIKNFKMPNYNQIFGDLIFNSGMFRHSASQAVADIVKSLKVSPIDPSAGVAAFFRNFDTSALAGNSFGAAIAAITAGEEKRFENIRLSFAGMVAEALKGGFKDLEEKDKQSFARFEKLINEKIATLQPNQVSGESLWKFLVTLFMMLGAWGTTVYQIKQANDSSKTQTEQHAQSIAVWERVASQLQRLFPENDNGIYYVAERRAALKVKPSFGSYTITVIFTNQKVRLVRMSYQWIYIEYFDYIEGVPKYGWASKKYLKRLE